MQPRLRYSQEWKPGSQPLQQAAWAGMLLLLWGLGAPLLALAAEEKPATDPGFKDHEGFPTLIEPFTPPTLAELDAKTTWVEQPVVDSLERFADFLRDNPPPLSVPEALKLRNLNADENEKIIASLRILPSKDNPQEPNAKITRRLKADLRSFNPLLRNSIEESDYHGLTGVSLFSFDWNMVPYGNADFISSWHTSQDGLYEKVVLRDDLTWSDGQPITAHDVVFSYRVIMHPEVPIPAVRSGTDEIRWIEAYDDRTLVFFHKKALATSIWNINFPLIPRHVYAQTWHKDVSLVNHDAHKALEQKPVVGGEYELVERVHRRYVLLKRREGYYRHKGKEVRRQPTYAEIRLEIIEEPNTALLALKRGDIDELEISVAQWKKQTTDDKYFEKNTKIRGTEWTYFYFGWNNKHIIFKDRAVREAMAYAYPHETLLKGINNDLTEPCLGIFHPASPMFPQTPVYQYKKNLPKAAEILAKAGWEDHDGDNVLDKVIDGQKIDFRFTMICSSDPLRIATCQLMKNSLEKLGIRCNIRPMEQSALFDKEQKHDFDAYFGGWGSGSDPDTSDNIWSTQAAIDGRNFVSYSNRYVDGLYQLGKQLPYPKETENLSPTAATIKAERERIFAEYKLGEVGIAVDATRHQIYAKIHELIYQDQPVTFLYYRNSYYGISNRLRGYQFSPRGPYHYSPGFGSIWPAAE
ncbi:MAG: ABC transporter substrate-binding protein [Pirellulales bacterium]|nr:ABC transporter substrate-binding protein [Pirellulales bacterium]